VLNAHHLLGRTLLSVCLFQLMAGYDCLSATHLQNFLLQVLMMCLGNFLRFFLDLGKC
jgi:hypothetical protein